MYVEDEGGRVKAIGRVGDSSLLREMGQLDVAFMDIRHMNPRAGMGNETAAVQKKIATSLAPPYSKTLKEQNYISIKRDRWIGLPIILASCFFFF